MMILDLAAMVGAAVTGLTVFARAEVLRPSVRSAYASNILVRLLMDATALACVFVVFELWGGAELPEAAAWFFILCAVTSSAMMISMFVHDGRLVVAEVRAADVVEMRTAVEDTLPAALDNAMPQVIKDLAAVADPYEPKV